MNTMIGEKGAITLVTIKRLGLCVHEELFGLIILKEGSMSKDACSFLL
jgi:hypothetical protein